MPTALSSPTAYPAFVVGASRADRALLQPMLDAHRNISCEPETELLALQLNRAASGRKARWVQLVDITTLRLRKIDRRFPTSRIIHVVGDGWNGLGGTHAIRVFAASIRGERYCEVQATELVTNPEWALRRILGFLGENWDPTVLQFAPHLADAA